MAATGPQIKSNDSDSDSSAPRRPARNAPNYPQSKVLEDGTYKTGRMHQLRNRNHEKAYATRPSLRDAIECHAASLRFRDNSALLNFDECLDDGFRARFAEEVLLIDSRSDPTLHLFVTAVSKMFEVQGISKDDTVERKQKRVSFLSMMVADVLGGPARASTKQLMRERCNAAPADTPIGLLLGGQLLGQHEDGSGICRHRSLLFKYCCNALGVAECAVVSGVFMHQEDADRFENLESYRQKVGAPDHMWNIVRIDGISAIVDCTNYPGAVFHASNPVAAKYHRANGTNGLTSMSFDDGDLTPLPSSSDEAEEDEEDEKDHIARSAPSIGRSSLPSLRHSRAIAPSSRTSKCTRKSEGSGRHPDDYGTEAAKPRSQSRSAVVEVFCSGIRCRALYAQRRNRINGDECDGGADASECGWVQVESWEYVCGDAGEQRVLVTFEVPGVGLLCCKSLRTTSENLRGMPPM